MQLRNCILIALAFDATPAELEQAHDIMDRVYGAGAVDPEFVVSQSVPGADANGVTATGAQTMGAVHAGSAIPSHEAADLDVNGLPWDERIHSSNKKKTAKDEWRAKRNVDATLLAKVEAELKAATGAVAPAADATPAIAAPPSLPGGNLPPMPGASTVDPAYTAIVKLFAENMQPNGRLTDEWVKSVLTHFQVPDGNLQNLAHAPQLIPAISEYVTGALNS